MLNFKKKKVRYGVIGVKGIGDLHCRLAKENESADLLAVADIDPDRAAAASERYGARKFTDYREMLGERIVEAVSIATPHHLHAAMAMDCLNAGVHIYVEKPLANRPSDAEAVVRKAKSMNLKLCVGHQYRVHRTSKTMKHLIQNGSLGNILRVLWSWAEFRSDRYYVRDRWRGSWKQSGGGIVASHGIHELDLLCWMIGQPVRVCALIGNQLHDSEGEDAACANILFENGALASLQVTINQPRGYSIRQVAGDKGMIVLQNLQSLTFDRMDRILLGEFAGPLFRMTSELEDPMEQPKIRWRTAPLVGDFPKWKKLLQRAGMLKKRPHGISILMDSFIQAILSGGEPLVTGESTLPSLDLMGAIILSAMKNKTVSLPLDREEFDHLYENLSEGRIHVPRFRH